MMLEDKRGAEVLVLVVDRAKYGGVINPFEDLKLALCGAHDHLTSFGAGASGNLVNPYSSSHVRHGHVRGFEILECRPIQHQFSELVVADAPGLLRTPDTGLVERSHD